MSGKPVRMILVGAGFMGATHLEAAEKMASVQFVGVVDSRRSAAKALAAKNGIPDFETLEEGMQALQPDAADICTPTPSHLAMIRICAAHGTHVLCEKPLALTPGDAERIRRVCDEKAIRLMTAQVLRFWPEYVYALDVARRGKVGGIRSVLCRRLSSPPGWNSWMMKPGIGDGAGLDLQVHEMDFIYQLLGKPVAIQASGTDWGGAVNAVRNRLVYAGGVSAISEASYLMPASYPFRMAFALEFENAVLEMDSWRPKGERLSVYPARGKSFFPVLSSASAYGAEIDYFARRLKAKQPFDRVPMEGVIEVLRMCRASIKSCRTGKSVTP